MQTFVWGAEFHTGIEEVDQQHHELVDLFNELSEALAQGRAASESILLDVFERLSKYVECHFSAEKELMLGAGVDQRHVAVHLKVHDDFNEQLIAIWGARHSLSNPAKIILSFLTAWLCLHILGTDQLLARQVALIADGHTPAQAYEEELRRPRDNSAEAMIKALRNTYQVVSRLSLELISANRLLEDRVAARTAELQRANEALVVANQKLEVHSQTDGLLGIANRSYFDARLADEWNHASRTQTAIGLLMVDVDYFKNYNDLYGHLAGDACLQAVAGVAASRMVRVTDLLARFGGEEFVVVLPNTSIEGAQKVALGICEAVSALNIPHGASSAAEHVTVSVGVASAIPDREAAPESLIDRADQALYTAKQQGRNRVCLG
jgi:hemerythrin